SLGRSCVQTSFYHVGKITMDFFLGVQLHFTIDQAKNPNPPVYISVNDDLITYVKCVDNIELFLEKMFEEAKNEM
ncbi:MAG: hypothetical protein KHY49_09590, partial [Oscillospiraceae bacterium]|nr:hypothetical protein [Oscillospiraceae bacterium]